MSSWPWIVVLQIMAVGFLIAEVFLPSAGLLMALMLGSTGLSIWLAFEVSRVAGMAVLGADLVLLPIAGWLALTKVPSTPAALRDQLDGQATDSRLDTYIDRDGICETDLRPVGRVRIGSDIIEAQATHGFLAKGTRVRIARSEGGHLFVQASEPPSAA